MRLREDLGTLPDFEHVSSIGVRFVRYKNGLRCFFKVPAGEAPTRGDSSTILDQSDASRRRAAFALGNAECDWLAMTTLTFHSDPGRDASVSAIEKIARAFQHRFGEPICGWIKEFQQRGVIHFHLFHSAQSMAGQTILNGSREIRADDGREVSRGGFDFWIRATWLKISGQKDDREAVWWHSRGIVEFFDSPDAAGRYVAKEAAKREQKVLPAGYEKGIGRWWRLAPKWRPNPRGWGTLDLHQWPWEEPVALVWSGETVATCIEDYHAAPAAMTNPKAWLQLNGFEALSAESDSCGLSSLAGSSNPDSTGHGRRGQRPDHPPDEQLPLW